ncbi:MFS general substrate transporter [Delitschia confertaspora ATCC 74209]|uniref:MFS general substrate transporter n=1 Tax=Delitschia confertaspora ATCC 74209 TaxID=1513339 RepID=A0A9P4JU45_9PLEO|nr:MFS general substrate transporter [Delitschia confertaspora ATCC 74209]
MDISKNSPENGSLKEKGSVKSDIVPSSERFVSQDEENRAVQEEEEKEEEDNTLPFSKARLLALVFTVTGAAFLNTLGVQAAVIILPTIGRDLGIPDSRQQWIVSAYSLTFGCFLLLWGRLADVYGKRLIFIWGSLWITISSIILPFVPNEIGFDVFRGLQGLGAAAMVPTAIGILGVTFPPGKAKNYAFSCYGAGAPLGSVFGNIFGGVLGQYLDWRWVFWIFAILGGVVAVCGYFVIPVPPAPEQPINMKTHVDWIGGIIVTIGLLVLLFALTEGNVVGWSTPWVPTLIAVAVILIAIFVIWQWYLENKTERRPLMKVSIFKNSTFSAAMIIMLLVFASFSNYLIVTTYFFQNYLGLDAIQTTLRFVPTGVCGIMVVAVTAQLLSRVRGNILLTFGTICVSVSSLLFAIPIDPHTTYWAYGFPAMVLSVCGVDTLYPALTLFTAKSLPQEDQALGGALINAVGQAGRAIGLALSTAVQTAVTAKAAGVDVEKIGNEGGSLLPGNNALKDGLRAASWFNFAVGLSALLVVWVFFRGAGIIGGRH